MQRAPLFVVQLVATVVALSLAGARIASTCARVLTASLPFLTLRLWTVTAIPPSGRSRRGYQGHDQSEGEHQASHALLIVPANTCVTWRPSL
jgi:hypothetical protein